MKKLILTILVMLTGISLLATDYLLTGTIYPEVNGTYVESGVYNAKPYYQNGTNFIYWETGGYNLWFAGASSLDAGWSLWVDNTFATGSTPTLGAVYTKVLGGPPGEFGTGNVSLAPPAITTFYVTGDISPASAIGTYTYFEDDTFGEPVFTNGIWELRTVAGWGITTNGEFSSPGWYADGGGSSYPPYLGNYSPFTAGHTGTAVVSTNAPTPPSTGGTQLPFSIGGGTLINMVDE